MFLNGLLKESLVQVLLPFLIINVKSLLKKERCTFGRRKNIWKKQGLFIFEI
jgi:hypothetical protein